MRNARCSLLLVILLVAGSTLAGSPRLSRHAVVRAMSLASLPRPDHVVVVMEENRSFGNIIGSPSAPYINSLAAQGAVLTDTYANEHPSQPNYLDLFSGSNQGVTDDNCPYTFDGLLSPGTIW